MATDEERREVARMAELNADSGAQFWKFNVARAMGMNGKESDASMWHRIADLIEPDTTTDTTSNGPVSPIASPTVDCDALLKMEDDMYKDGRTDQASESRERHFINGRDVMEYPQYIRKALGVDDG